MCLGAIYGVKSSRFIMETRQILQNLWALMIQNFMKKYVDKTYKEKISELNYKVNTLKNTYCFGNNNQINHVLFDFDKKKSKKRLRKIIFILIFILIIIYLVF